MGLKIDGIATNGNLDSSGEVLNVKGHDISDLIDGKGVLNWEHEKSAEDILGAIIYAKKIMSEKDCDNERQRMYYDLSGGPYVYIIAEFYEDEMHPPAVAAAAMIRYYYNKKIKMLAGFSIEGQTLERDGNKLERSVGRRVALTLRPCNKSAIAGLLEDPKMKGTVEKSQKESRIRSYEVEDIVFDDPLLELKQSVIELQKTLTAGGGGVAPSELTGGAALVREQLDHGQKNRLKAAVRDWNRMRPLREVVKAALPEISDNYVDHFVDVAKEISLRKGMPPLGRIGAQHSGNKAQNDDQKKLIEGLYWDKAKMYNPGHDSFNEQRSLSTLINDAGDKVLVKQPNRIPALLTHEGVAIPPNSEDAAQNSAAYSQLAQDFFGLGDHVPTTNHFYNPHTPQETRKYQAMKLISGAEPILTSHPAENQKAFKSAREDGSLHKLAMMDLILGNHDERHEANVLLGPDKKILHIDNDHAFNHFAPRRPVYFNQDLSLFGPGFPGIGYDTSHKDALKWVNGLNANRLHDILKANGMSDKAVQNTLSAFMTVRHMANKGKTFNDMHQAVTNMAPEAPQDASLSS